MKIEKGKLYLDTDSGTLFKADMTTDNYDNFASDKIAVHCPTKEDWDYVVSVVDNGGDYDYTDYEDESVVYIDRGWYASVEWAKENNYHIITIDQFKEFYPPISKEEQKESYDDPYNWGSIIIDSDNYKTNALEAEYQNRGAILRTHIPLANTDEFNPNSEKELKEDEEILRRAKEGVSDFYTITESIADLLVYKNAKYGNAVLEPLQIFGGKCKAGTRLDDKLGRIKNSGKLRKNDVADLIGYLILTCKENNWTDFSEFKD